MNDQQQPDLVSEWLKRAQSDLRLAKIALQTPGVLLEDACFHAQQCAEKALKALLTSKQILFPRTHSIDLLLDLLKENEIAVPITVDEAFVLSQYAVQTRYPGQWEPITFEEAQSVVDRSNVVLEWVLRQVS